MKKSWLAAALAVIALILLYRIFWWTPEIHNFSDAKYVLENHVIHDQQRTVYCDARFDNNKNILDDGRITGANFSERGKRMEWEHAVPVSRFGTTFPEWHKSNKLCKNRGKYFGGRKCAEQNPEFVKIETDLYNLFPAIGSVNASRANREYAELPDGTPVFGSCGARVSRKQFEPPDRAKGQVARASLYMAGRYPERVSFTERELNLFRSWSRKFPVTAQECQRARRIERIQKNENTEIKTHCLAKGLW